MSKFFLLSAAAILFSQVQAIDFERGPGAFNRDGNYNNESNRRDNQPAEGGWNQNTSNQIMQEGQPVLLTPYYEQGPN